MAVRSEQQTRWFLGEGANPNARCDWDNTPLSYAVREASLPTLALLVNHGGDLSRGQLLHFAVARQAPGRLAVVEWLLANGAHVNARMYENDRPSWIENRPLGMGTPLHKAVEMNDEMTVRLLLSYNADRHVLDSVGRTAYDIAIARGYRTLAEIVRI